MQFVESKRYAAHVHYCIHTHIYRRVVFVRRKKTLKGTQEKNLNTIIGHLLPMSSAAVACYAVTACLLAPYCVGGVLGFRLG